MTQQATACAKCGRRDVCDDCAPALRKMAEDRISNFFATMLVVAAIEAVQNGIPMETFLRFAGNLPDAGRLAYEQQVVRHG